MATTPTGVVRLLAFVLLCASPLLSGQAYGQAVVDFSPAAASVDCGATVFVDVTVDATVVDLQGFSFTFEFDPSYVTPVSVTAGPALTGAPCESFFRWVNEETFTSTVEVDATLLGCATIGSGAIIRLGFDPGTDRGQSALTTLQGRVRDSNNDIIEIVAPSGTIDNICNTAPIANADAYDVDEGDMITATVGGTPAGVLDNDTDADTDPLTATLISGPSHASAFTFDTDGSFEYTHDGSETVTDEFIYEADDGQGGTAQATATITITGVNDPPVANDDAYDVDEGGVLIASVGEDPAGVLDNDTDADTDPLTATPVSGPAHALAFNLETDGSFTYVHDSGEAATDAFVYQVDDGQGGTAQATATITILGTNDPPEVTNPGTQSSNENEPTSLQIVAIDAEQPDLLYTASGLPPGLTIDLNSGLISGTIACGAAGDSPYAVTVDVDDQMTGVAQIGFAWNVTAFLLPTAIADLAVAQVKTGNDDDGTTMITVTWTGVAANHTVAVYRKGYGDYPEYDDGSGAEPTAPTDPAQAVLENWTLVPGVTSSEQNDEPPLRDFYYYVAFVSNECAVVSSVSNLAGGVLNYHLGDVSDGVTPGQGNNRVFTEDISLLGIGYAIDSLDGRYNNILDIGPTTDGSTDGRPTTDNLIEFEDLIIFALNYDAVSKSGPSLTSADLNVLTLMVPASAAPGTTLEVPLWLQGDGQIQGLSIGLTWDANVVVPVGHTAGELLASQELPTVCYEAEPGLIDVAVLGRTGSGLTGEGIVATVTFEVLAGGDPGFGFGEMRVRDSQNQELDLVLQTDTASPVPTATPTVSGLYANYPNPFNPRTTLAFGIAEAGPVDLKIYGVDGRLVRTVLSRNLVPGTYSEVWDGTSDRGSRVASGVYFVRLVAPDRSESGRITLLK